MNSRRIQLLKYFMRHLILGIMCLPAVFFPVATAQEMQDNLQVEYSFIDENIKTPPQLNENQVWQPFNSQKNNLSPRKTEKLWLKIVTQSVNNEPVTLKFEKVFMRFKVFSRDGQMLYAFGGDKGYAGFPPHLLTLNPERNRSEFYMRVESEHQRIGPVGRIALGQRSEFLLQMLKEDLVPIFVSSILAILSISGLFLFLFYRNVRTYLHLALFSTCAFFYLVAGLRLRHQLGLDPALLGNLSLIGLFSSPLFFIKFYSNIFSIRENNWIKSALWFNVLFVAISLTGFLFSPLGLLPFLTYFYAFSVPIFTTIFTHSLLKLSKHTYAKTFYLGFAFLFLGGLWEMANEIRLFNSNFRMLHVGILLFFLCLTAMQGQFFTKLFQNSRKNELAEIAARDRLQRVFDCTYALSQARNYREALAAVASAISKQLSLSGHQFTIDFMLTRVSFMEKNNGDGEFVHFTYVNKGNHEEGEIYEISASDSDKPPNSLVPHRELTPATSIPVIRNTDAIREYISSAPESVLTVPLETNSLDGAIIIRRYDKNSFGQDEHQQVIKFLNAVSASLLIALKNIEYLRDVRKKAQIDVQLDAAESIQSALLPPSLNLDNVALSSYARSAGKTGGDWFGYYHSEKRRRLFVTIGDVTGHDFAASIVTGVAAGIIKSWESYNSDDYDSASEAVQQLAQHVNRVMLDANRGLKFMSMLFVCLELDTGSCHVVSAGHPHPFHIVPNQRPESVVVSGSLLGIDPNATFSAETINLSPKDSLVLYTDGLLENTGPNGECMTRRSILQFCRNVVFDSVNLDSFVKFARDIWKSHPPDDDVSIVAITWKPEANTTVSAA
jgi:serine phosphatase RsbU (regulator of sigma subunit)